MISCIIIDDEPKARKLLQAIITEYCPQLSIAALCDDLPDGIKAIKKHKPNLVLLDIEMPGHSGLELLDFFNEDEIDFDIIFTTAYNDYAIQAFRFSAVDYLLKPIQHTQLMEAVQRVIKKQNHKPSEQLKTLKQNLDSSLHWEEKRIAVPGGQTLFFFKPSEIIMIKGEAAYSEIYLADGSKMLASRNLKHFEDMLIHIPVFFRSHKSYIINKTAVEQYVKSDGGYLTLQGGLTANISAERVAEFLEWMK
jgi:two-component system, LytTR family, response regulator